MEVPGQRDTTNAKVRRVEVAFGAEAFWREGREFWREKGPNGEMKRMQCGEPMTHSGAENTARALRPGLCGRGDLNDEPHDVLVLLWAPGNSVVGDVDRADLVNLPVKWRREEDEVRNHPNLGNWRGCAWVLCSRFHWRP